MTRLSIRIRILALGLALWHLQASQQIVSAQKYYMNFAFNNNNPNANNEDASANGMMPPGANREEASEVVDSHGAGHRGHDSEDEHGVDADLTEELTDEMEDHSHDNGDNEDDHSGKVRGNGEEEEEDHNNVSDNMKGLDGDDDDSDSHDPADRREKLEELNENADAEEHAHHSSYEISIDDSFGGRYVRSIYESSESAGHPGASAQDRVDSLEHSGSEEKVERLYGDDDYEEFNGE